MDQLGAQDPRVIGGYRLIGRLGEGGMGRVYLARSNRGRTVAVKLVRGELTEQDEFRARFRQEVRAARRVGGRWTAAVLDADTEAAQPWVATGYIPGPSLRQVVTESGPLPVRSVRLLAGGLARALRDVHDAGIVHRDLKPSNVLVTIDGPRVIDFGIARALETSLSGEGLTRAGAIVGTPGFLSPEQVRGDRVTPASDVFCLGSVLAYAATGRMPFGGADSGVHAVLFRIAEEDAELSELPQELRELVHGCLAKEVAERRSLADLLAATGEPDPADEPWLPGALIAQLGRHATELLEAENPSGDTGEQGVWLAPECEVAGDEVAAVAGQDPGPGPRQGPPVDVPVAPVDESPVARTPTTADAGSASPVPPPQPVDSAPLHGMLTAAAEHSPHAEQPRVPAPGPSGVSQPAQPVQPVQPAQTQVPSHTPTYPHPGLNERPSRNNSSVIIAVLVTLLLVVTGIAGYLVSTGGTDDKAEGSGSTPTGERDAQDSTDDEPTGDQPSPGASDADGGIPSGFLGTWKRASGTGNANQYRIQVQQGEIGDTVVSISATGPTFDCRFQADLRSAGPPVKLGPSRVTTRSSESACGAGPVSRLDLTDGGDLRRSFADGRPSKVFTRAG